MVLLIICLKKYVLLIFLNRVNRKNIFINISYGIHQIMLEKHSVLKATVTSLWRINIYLQKMMYIKIVSFLVHFAPYSCLYIKMKVYILYQNIVVTDLPWFPLDFDIMAIKMSLNNALFLNVFSCNTTIVWTYWRFPINNSHRITLILAA